MDIDIGRDEIEAASRRIASDIRRTPLLRIDGGQLGIDDVELWLKLEHLQVGGSFKARGMFNRMRANPIPAAGVVIASGGNAAIAVACAAKALGVPCEVFVPQAASRANESFDLDTLVVSKAIVNMGQPLKRFGTAAQGRATPIRKRTSHVEIHVGPREEN